MSFAGQPKPTVRQEGDATPLRQAAPRAPDWRRGMQAVRVLPGEAYVTARAEEISLEGFCALAREVAK